MHLLAPSITQDLIIAISHMGTKHLYVVIIRGLALKGFLSLAPTLQVVVYLILFGVAQRLPHLAL